MNQIFRSVAAAAALVALSGCYEMNQGAAFWVRGSLLNQANQPLAMEAEICVQVTYKEIFYSTNGSNWNRPQLSRVSEPQCETVNTGIDGKFSIYKAVMLDSAATRINVQSAEITARPLPASASTPYQNGRVRLMSLNTTGGTVEVDFIFN